MKKQLAAFILFFPFILCMPAMAETLTIVGTGDGVNVLKNIGMAFTAQNPGVTVEVPKSIGSGGGVKAVGKGEYPLGRVARGIKDKEKHFGLSYKPYAKIPVVFFVNKSVSATDVSAQQIVDIYTGKITKWDEVGGGSGKIRVVRREDGDSSLKVLKKSFPGFKDLNITKKSKTALKTPEMVSLITQKAGTIGFGPLDVAMASGLNILNVDGREPSSSLYPAVGIMGLIYKEENYTGTVKKFIDFATSGAASAAIVEAGGSN